MHSPSAFLRVPLWPFFCLLPLLHAQSTPRLELTVDSIMRGHALTGYPPQSIRWSEDSARLYFQWKQAADAPEKETDTYVVNRDGSGLKKLTEEESQQAPPTSGHRSLDRKLTAFSEKGDIYIYDHTAGKRRRITRTTESESNPRLTHDSSAVTFLRAGNLFRFDLASGLTDQLTDFRTPATADASTRKGSDSQEFLKKEEKDLLEIVRNRAAKREEDEKKRKKELPPQTNLTGRQTVESLQLSPDAKQIIAAIREPAEKNKPTQVPDYVTESGYTANLNARSKVGDDAHRMRLALVNASSGELKWIEHGIKETPEAKPEDKEPPKPRDRAIRLFNPIFSDDGSKAVLQGAAEDNKDRWIFALDPETAKLRILAHIHDDAWVIFGALSIGWLPDNQRIYYVSERDGWAHLYTVPFSGGDPTQLTSGKWEVGDVSIAPDKSKFYLTTSEVHLGEDHLYSMSFDGSPRTRITTSAGGHNATVSPDGSLVATIHSYTNRPPELYLQDNKPGAPLRKITTSPTPEFSTYPWLDVPIVHIPARDGVQVPARIYKPANFRKGGPAVIFVHGAGYLQNVHRRWSSYFREYMFHHLLMERGYLVLDLDYRASAGYGRDHRTAIYRHMGGKDLDDHVDAANWAVKTHGVDRQKIGIYGGSYGGFITLMAMFTQPDVFRAGAALRPVTDWAHYNHGYTSNILNTPHKDPEAFRRSSPIYHAAGLKGALLIAHGMVDINVHFQDAVRLVQKLIELRKDNWELAVYPVEDHAFVQPSSWADEYKRILRLFESNLK
ncbi:MAG: S9 family peptidase [Acidimicrobiia bacterium]|nr:S9 family peptidase [Acidimicrobiia bacterium]